jgi:hypothetical protein
MNTLENNKLIAEFMGCLTHAETKAHLTNYGFYHTEDLQYHSDWNWLMEVVEKIENLTDKDNFVLYDFNIYSDAVIITDQQENTLVIVNKSDGNFTTKKEAVYNACVEFIKYYNLQNS